MKLLLDTHVFLWWRLDDDRLTPNARTIVLNERNEVVVSAATAWEIVIKRGLGRLEFEGRVDDAVREEGFGLLPVSFAHVEHVSDLPVHHRDPFDRLLIAQARVEGLTLVTHDAAFLAYDGFDCLVT